MCVGQQRAERELGQRNGLEMTKVKAHYSLGRVENSKTFQNQMAQCFFIGLYDIETGDDFYFFQKKFFDGWKWILKKSIFTREKWLK